MIRHVSYLILALLSLCLPLTGNAVDSSLEVSEQTLNQLIYKVGVLSDGGVAQPYNVTHIPGLFEECVHVGFIGCGILPDNIPGLGSNEIPLVVCRKKGGGITSLPIGDPVSYQWWITDTSLSVESGSMSFTATVTTHVGNHWQTTTRTVGAQVGWDLSSNTLQLMVDSFQVPVEPESGSIDVDPVNVSRFYSTKIPIIPQQFSVPLPNGTSRNLTGRVVSATPVYMPNKLKVNFDVAF